MTLKEHYFQQSQKFVSPQEAGERGIEKLAQEMKDKYTGILFEKIKENIENMETQSDGEYIRIEFSNFLNELPLIGYNGGLWAFKKFLQEFYKEQGINNSFARYFIDGKLMPNESLDFAVERATRKILLTKGDNFFKDKRILEIQIQNPFH